MKPPGGRGVLSSVPRHQIRLDSRFIRKVQRTDGCWHWMGALNDLRLVLGTRLDVQEDTFATEPDLNDPRGQALAVYGYLSWRATHFRIGGDDVRLDTGVLFRRSRRVRLDRLRVEGTLQGAELRTRNYRSLALTSAIWGVLTSWMMIGGLLGVLSLVYASRAYKQLKARGESSGALAVSIILAVLAILGAGVIVVLVIIALMGKLK